MRVSGSPSARSPVLFSPIPATFQTVPAGRFTSSLVVTMRWATSAQAIMATQLTSRFPFNHGAPLHWGDPVLIGADLEHPLFGEPIDSIPKGNLPVFWACGVTPQRAAIVSKLGIMVTHAPGHVFITDLSADQFCIA